jgi:hypothetical protein
MRFVRRVSWSQGNGPLSNLDFFKLDKFRARELRELWQGTRPAPIREGRRVQARRVRVPKAPPLSRPLIAANKVQRRKHPEIPGAAK